MKQRLYAFFSGRCGFDALARVILLLCVLLLVVCLFIPLEWVRYILQDVAIVGIVCAYLRAMSRNLDKRHKENAAFLEFFKIRRLSFKERKTHHYYRCPRCRSWLRVPRGIGEITIKCRVCEHRFDKKT